VKAIDLTGRKFGRLTALRFTGETKSSGRIWECRCDCGKTLRASVGQLRSGMTKSCGCWNLDVLRERSTKHGYSKRGHKNRIYWIWGHIKSRCNSPSNPDYANYGGRGISICEEWKDFNAFLKWASSTGYHEGLSIDRIDVNGNYEPSNCRWANDSEQANNKRNNHIEIYNGKPHTLAELSRISGIPYHTLKARLNVMKWPLEKALKHPVRDCGRVA